MDFAVKVKGDPPDHARWVLAVDPAFSRLLMVNDDKTLEWVEMADCKFVKLAGPEQPRPVFAVPMQQQGKLARVTPTLVKGNHR